MEDEDELVDLNFVNRQADDLEVMKNYYQENFYNFEKHLYLLYYGALDKSML